MDYSKGDPTGHSSGPPSTRETIRIALIVIALAALGVAVWQLARFLLLVFGAALIAVLFRALADWTAKWTRLPYGFSLAFAVVALFAILGAGVFLSGDRIASEMTSLAAEVPRALEKLREDIAAYQWGELLLRDVPKSTDDLQLSPESLANYAATLASSISGGVAGAFILLVLALYLSIDPGRYVTGAVTLAPVYKRARVMEVLGEIHMTLRWWLVGKIISMTLIGILTMVGLILLGIPLAGALAVIAALLTFIPNFGPVISAVPAVLLAFVESPMTAVYVVLLYAGIQTVESYLITPMIQQETVALPPGLTISAQVAMGILLGAPGVVLATPFVAMLLVAVKRFYVEDVLEGAS